jgi:hydrogenase-4 component E
MPHASIPALPQSLDTLLEIVLILNFFILGAARLRTAIYLVALQGVILGISPLWVDPDTGIRVTLLVFATLGVKGFVIPRMLFFAMRDASIGPEVRPIGGFITSLLLGGAGTGLALVFAKSLPLRPEHMGRLVVPASLATVLAGFLMLVTRRRTITQTLGYLVLENGIFVFGLLLLEAMPALVEAGVLLDLFVAVFVMGIIIQHINRALDPLDIQHLSTLKE